MDRQKIKKGYKRVTQAARKGGRGASEIAGSIKPPTGIVGAITNVSNAAKGIKLIGQAIKDTAKGSVEIAKGIFNDPNWWNKPITPYLAVNASRPMNPSDLYSISSEGTSLGVGHMSVLEVNFNNIFTSPVMAAAINKMFQSIRDNLRSNLQYTAEDLTNYLQLVTMITIETKMIERSIGWNSYSRSDIPEFHDVWVTYPVPSDVGRVNLAPRANLGDGLADAISRVDILKSSVNQLPIPVKLGEFLSWLYGSVFTDEDSYNPQVYYVDATKVDVYLKADDTTTTSVNPRDITVEQLIDQIGAVLSKYGALVADLKRINEDINHSIGLVDFVKPDQYRPIMLMDHEFINFVINGYTFSPTAGFKQPLFFRMDIVDKVMDDPGHIAATTNGMGAILASSAFQAISVIAQNFYFQAGNATMPRNLQITTSNQVLGNAQAFTVANGLWAARLTSAASDSIKWSQSADTQSYTYTLAAKSSSDTVSAGLLSFRTLFKTSTFKIPAPTPLVPVNMSDVSAVLLSGMTSAGDTKVLIVVETLKYTVDGKVTITNPRLRLTVNGIAQGTDQPIQDGVVGLSLQGGLPLPTARWDVAFTINNYTTGQWANVARLFYSTSTVLPVDGPASSVVYSVKATSTTYVFTYEGMGRLSAWVTQMFDYHIPFISDFIVRGASGSPLTVSIDGETMLLKECYNSVIYNKLELEAVVQQLYYNLLSIE